MFIGKRAITIEDLAAIKWVGEPQVSPDGRFVVYVQQETDLEYDRYRSHLWLLRLDATDSDTPQQLSFGDQEDVCPRWSPDGRSIAFLSDRGDLAAPHGRGLRQVYMLSVDRLESRRLTSGRLRPEDVAWAPDGQAIAFIGRAAAERNPGRSLMVVDGQQSRGEVRETAKPTVVTRLAYRMNGEGFWDGTYRQVFRVDLDGEAPRQLTHGDYDHREPAWSPDGRLIAFVANRSDMADRSNTTDVWVVAAAGGVPRRLTLSVGPVAAPSWSPRGDAIAYIGHDDACGPATNTGVWSVKLDGSPPVHLTKNVDRTYGYHVNSDMRGLQPRRGRPAWSGDGRLLFVPFEARGAHQVDAIDHLTQNCKTLPGVRRDVFGYSFDRAGGRAVIAASDPATPGDLWMLTMTDGDQTEERRLTKVNDELLAELELSRPQHCVWDGQGRSVEGWVLPPLRLQRGLKCPAVLNVHGGPHSSFGETFFHEWQLLAALGIAVIYTNPRGSQGYGQQFAAAIQHDWGGADFDDLMLITDEVAKRFEFLDPSRMGIAGGSYGGYMTNWVIGHTDRFRVAISERSVVNLASHSTASDLALRHGDWSFPGQPWEAPEWYWAHSPLAYAPNIRTPLLLMHSEEDYRCPISEAEQLFAVLAAADKDVVFVRFPGEHHDLSRVGRPSNRFERLRLIVRWLTSHLLGAAAGEV